MIFFDHAGRGEQPAFFYSQAVKAAREQARDYFDLPEDEQRQIDPPRIWRLPWGEDVLPALLKLSHSRCAFCEYETEGLRPWRFRPPAMAEGVKGDYLWNAFTWENIFPICPNCVPRQPDSFPLRGTRNPETAGDLTILLHPGEPATQNAFTARMDGRLTGKNQRGRVTITHYNLNRDEVVQARAQALRDHLALEIDWLANTSAPLTGFVVLALDRLIRIVARNHPDMPRYTIRKRPDAIAELLAQWSRHINLPAALAEASETAREEDRAADLAAKADHAPPPRSTPRIKDVSITTFKSLEDIAFTLPKTLGSRDAHPAEAPCLMILGENATGKSSILQAIALACLPRAEAKKLGLSPEQLTLNPEYLGRPDYLLIKNASKITVTFHDGPARQLLIDGRAKSFAWDGEEAPLIFAYGAHRMFGRKARRRAERHFDTLFHDDRLLSNPEDWLRRLWTHDRDSLNEVVAALRHIIQIDGDFKSIGFDDPSGDPRCMIRLKRRGLDGKTQTSPQPLAIVSSGFRAVLAMVCDIMAGLMLREGSARAARRARAIVLIDEIEAHLHPRWKLHIMDGLRRALPHVTFIVTSHDPLCLRGMFNGEVMALNRYLTDDPDGLDLPERIERIEAFENIEAMTVDQLLTSDLFQLLSADDIGTERQLAHAADMLASHDATADDLAVLDAEIARAMPSMAQALPIGRTEAGRLVQETVAEFLAARRHADAAKTSAARGRAKAAVRSYLQGLLP